MNRLSFFKNLIGAAVASALPLPKISISTKSKSPPIKIESLENSLKLLQFKESDLILWKKISNAPAAYNTVEEYDELIDYGNQNFK